MRSHRAWVNYQSEWILQLGRNYAIICHDNIIHENSKMYSYGHYRIKITSLGSLEAFILEEGSLLSCMTVCHLPKNSLKQQGLKCSKHGCWKPTNHIRASCITSSSDADLMIYPTSDQIKTQTMILITYYNYWSLLN